MYMEASDIILSEIDNSEAMFKSNVIEKKLPVLKLGSHECVGGRAFAA